MSFEVFFFPNSSSKNNEKEVEVREEETKKERESYIFLDFWSLTFYKGQCKVVVTNLLGSIL